MKITNERFAPDLSREWDEFLVKAGWEWYSSTSDYVIRFKHGQHSFAVRGSSGLCAVVHADIVQAGDYRILNVVGIAIERGTNRKKIVDFVDKHLCEVAQSADAQEVHLHIPPLSNDDRRLGWHESLLCEMGFSSELPWGDGFVTHAGYYGAIDLERPLEEIKSQYSKSHRLAVNKGERLSVNISTYGKEDYEAVFGTFRSILSDTLSRSGLNDYSDEFYDNIKFMICRGDAILAESISASGGRAYIVLDRFNKKYNYFAGCQTEEYVKWSGIVHLHHEMIKRLKLSGAYVYGLGPIFPTLSGKMGAICEFKRRFGGEKYPYLCGRKIIDSEKHLKYQIIGRILPTYRDFAKQLFDKIRNRN